MKKISIIILLVLTTIVSAVQQYETDFPNVIYGTKRYPFKLFNLDDGKDNETRATSAYVKMKSINLQKTTNYFSGVTYTLYANKGIGTLGNGNLLPWYSDTNIVTGSYTLTYYPYCSHNDSLGIGGKCRLPSTDTITFGDITSVKKYTYTSGLAKGNGDSSEVALIMRYQPVVPIMKNKNIYNNIKLDKLHLYNLIGKLK